jgi:membrane protein implicated in regulation of membrane protease activity
MDSDLRELSPIERYEQRAAHFLEKVKRLEARSRGYSNLRLAIFVIGIITVLIGPKDTPFWILLLTALILLLLVLFIAAAIRHRVIEERLETSREMVRRNEEGKARIARNWKDLPDRSPPTELVSNALVSDLDLFGRDSLFDLLCTANTWEGRNAVAQALLSGIERENLPARHAAIRELVPKLEFRQLLECATLPLRKSAVPGNVFFTPLQVDSTLLRQRLRRWFCLVSPFALVILLALTLTGFLPLWPIGLLLTLNYGVSFWFGRHCCTSRNLPIAVKKFTFRRHLSAKTASWR